MELTSWVTAAGVIVLNVLFVVGVVWCLRYKERSQR